MSYAIEEDYRTEGTTAAGPCTAVSPSECYSDRTLGKISYLYELSAQIGQITERLSGGQEKNARSDLEKVGQPCNYSEDVLQRLDGLVSRLEESLEDLKRI